MNMSEITIFVKPIGEGQFEWFGKSLTAVEQGDSEQMYEALPATAKLVLVLPAENVLLKRVEYDEAEKKLLTSTVPYTLESELSEDIEQLHFALGEPEGNSVDVVVMSKQTLNDYLLPLREQGLQLQAAIPEQLLVERAEKGWTLIIANERCLIRNGQYAGFAIKHENAGLALQCLAKVGLPDRFRVICKEQEKTKLADFLSEELKAVMDWKGELAFETMVVREWHTNQKSCLSLNLLQGEFESPLPWRRWLKQWKVFAALLVLAVALHLTSGFVQNVSLKKDIREINQSIEKAYREVVPRGRMVIPEKQLQRKINALKGDADSHFMMMYKTVAEVIGAVDGIRMQSMSFNNQQKEIRITLVAPGFNEIETLRSNLEKHNVTAELSGIQNDQGKSRARLVIKG